MYNISYDEWTKPRETSPTLCKPQRWVLLRSFRVTWWKKDEGDKVGNGLMSYLSLLTTGMKWTS